LFPAVVAYKIAALAATIDRRVGQPLLRIVRWLNRAIFGGLEGMHAVGLERAEEDEQYFLYTLLSPALALLFPFLDRLDYLRHIDQMHAAVCERIGRYYRSQLQRHVYAVGGGRTLLIKNALAPGRIRIYLRAFPDMRIIHLVRHPYDELPSWASLASRFLGAHSPQLASDSDEVRQFVTLAMEYYRIMIQLKRELPPERFIEIRYEDLVAAPKECVMGIYDRFGLQPSESFRETLRAEAERAGSYRSDHRYTLEQFGLKSEDIYHEMRDVFEQYGFEP
jgi:hypothetical protein